MYMKFIFLLFILQIAFVKEAPPEIKMTGAQISKCSSGTNVGKIDYSIKYTYSSITDIKSYFMMFFEEQSKKRPTICQLYYNSTEQNEGEEEEKEEEEEEKEEEEEEKERKHNLNELLDNLKEKLLSRLRRVKKGVDSLNNLNEELKPIIKPILNYNLMVPLKKVNDGMTKMGEKIDDLTDEKIIKPLDKIMTNIVNKINDIDMSTIKNKINETVCSFKLDIIDAIKKRNSNIKGKIDEIHDSPILKDIYDKFSELKDTYEDSPIFNDFDENLKEKVYDFIITKLDELMTKFNTEFIKGLLDIENKIESVKDLIKKGKDIKDIEDLGELIGESFEKLNEKIKDFMRNNEILRPVLEKFEDMKESISEKIEGWEEEKKIKEKMDEIKELYNNVEEVSKDKIGEILDIIKNMGPGNIKDSLSDIKDVNKELFEEIKDIISTDDIIKELKEVFDKFSFEDGSSNIVKELFEDLKEKSSNFVDKTIVLKLIVEKLNESFEQYKNKFEEYGLIDVLDSFYSNLFDLLKDLNIFSEESLQDVESTLNQLKEKIKNIDVKEILSKLSKIFGEDIEEKIKELDFEKNIEELKEIFSKYTLDEIMNEQRDNILGIFLDLQEKMESLQDDILDKIDEKKLKIKERLEESEIFSQFSKYIDSMEEISQMLENNKDNMMEKLFEVLDKIDSLVDINELKEKLGEIPDFSEIKDLLNIQETIDKIKNMFSNANPSDIFKKQKEAVESLLNELNEKIEKIKTNSNDLKEKIKDLEINKLLSSFEDSFKSLKELFASLYDINKDLKKPFNIILDDIKSINPSETVNKIIEKIPSLSDIQSKIDNIKENIEEKTNDVIEKVTELFEKINITRFEPLLKLLSEGDLNKPLNIEVLKNDTFPKIFEAFQQLNFLNSTRMNFSLYTILPYIEAINNFVIDIQEMFPNVNMGKIPDILSNINEEIQKLDVSGWISNSYDKLSSLLSDLPTQIEDFLKNNEQINEMKNNLKEVKDSFGDIDTTELKESFNSYTKSLKTLFEDLKEFNSEKLNPKLYNIVERIKKIDLEKILDELKKIPNLPQELLDKVKELKNQGDSKIKKIQEFVDSIDSDIMENKDKLIQYFLDLKETIVDDNLMPELEEQYENIKKHIEYSEDLFDKFKEHFSYLKKTFGALDDLAKEEKEKIENGIYDIIDKLADLSLDDITENIKDMIEMGVEKGKDILNIEEILDDIKEMFDGEKDIKEIISDKKDEILEKLLKAKEKLEEKGEEFLDEIGDKFQQVADVFEETGVKDAFEEHIEAIRNLIINYMDMPSIDELKESINNIKDKLNNVKGKELILILNTTLFEFKDDFFEQINTLPKLEKIIDNFFDALNFSPSEFKEKISNGINDKLKNNKMIAPIIDKFEDIKDIIEDELEEMGIMDELEEYAEKLKDFKEKVKEAIKEKNTSMLEEILEKLKKNINSENVKDMLEDFIESLSSCDNDFLKKLNVVDKVKESFEDIKESFGNIKEKFEDSKEKEIIVDSKEYIENKIKDLKNQVETIKDDKRFKKFIEIVDFINLILGKPLDKIKETEKIEDFKELFEKTKTNLENLKDKFEAIEVKEILYDLKEKIPNLDIKGKLVEINETKNEFVEEWKKYKDLETKGEKLEYIFTKGKDIEEKQLEEAKGLAKEMKEKLGSLNNKKINEIIDDVDEISANIIEKINKDIINEKIDNAISKIGDFEEKLDKFPEKEDEKEYQESVDDLKEKVKNINLTSVLLYIDNVVGEHLEITNLTMHSIKEIVLEYLEKPENVNNEEITKNISEIIKNQISEFNKSAQDILKDSKLSEILSENSLMQFVETINKIKDILKKYEDKSINEINEEIKETIANSKFGKDLKEKQEKLKEIYEKLQKTFNEKIDLLKFENIKNKMEENIDKMEDFIENMNILNEKLKVVYDRISSSKVLAFIKRAINNIDFTSIIDSMKKVKTQEINISQEIENVKRVKELTDELQSIYDSDPLIDIFLKLKKRNRLLSEKQKKIKKKIKIVKYKVKKNKRRLDSDGELTCKMDDISSTGQISSEQINDSNKMKYHIISKSQFSLSMNVKFNLNIQQTQLNCKNSYISTVKSSVSYAKHTNFTKNETEGRLKFRIVSRIKKTFTIPRIFYLVIKVKIYRKSRLYLGLLRNLQADEDDSDSYCILDEDEFDENTQDEDAPLNCFLYDDNVTDIGYLGNFSSDYIDLTDNNESFSYADDYVANNIDTTQTDVSTTGSTDGNKNGDQGGTTSDTTIDTTQPNSTNSRGGHVFFRKTSGGLKAGAIVGIILGALVALAIVIGVFIFFKNRKEPIAPFEGDLSDSHNQMQITNNSVKMPVNSIQMPVND